MKGKIVLVPFPFTDLSAVKMRPALVLHDGRGDLVLAFISSKILTNPDSLAVAISPDDPEFPATGLKCASLIRLDKIATIDRGLVVGEIGELPMHLRKQVN